MTPSEFRPVLDLIVPQNPVMPELDLVRKHSRFFSGGVLQDSEALSTWLGNNRYQLSRCLRRPTWKKGRTNEEIAVQVQRNNHWSEMSLAAIAEGTSRLHADSTQDLLLKVRGLVARYWSRRLDSMVMATLAGVVENDPGLRIELPSCGIVDLRNALSDLGCGRPQFTAIAMPGAIKEQARKNNLLDCRPGPEGEMIEYYDGLRVIEGVADANIGPSTYETYLLGSDFLEFGSGPLFSSTEICTERETGEKQLWNRVCWSVHPVGYQWCQETVNGGGPTNAELAASGTWRRAEPLTRDQIPLLCVRTKIAA